MILVEMEYLICSIAVLLFLYLIVFSYKNHSVATDAESSWWPWKLTVYNEWPYWLGGKPKRVPVPLLPTSSKPVIHSRPWGGGSRLANAI